MAATYKPGKDEPRHAKALLHYTSMLIQYREAERQLLALERELSAEGYRYNELTDCWEK